MLYNLYKILFENNNSDIEFKKEWQPTLEDWSIMVMNMNNHSNIHNIFRHIKDTNKLIKYYIITKELNWPGIDDYYNDQIYPWLLHSGLTFDEIHLIENIHIEIPNEINGLINNLSEFDKTGGISLKNQDLGYFANDKNLFNALNAIKGLKSFEFMRLPLDYKKLIDNIRIIKLFFTNGSIAYIKVDKHNSNCYHLKTAHDDNRNINKWRLKTCLELDMAPYEDQKIVDSDYMINWL